MTATTEHHGLTDHNAEGVTPDQQSLAARTKQVVADKLPDSVTTAATNVTSRVGTAASATGSWLAARKEDALDAVADKQHLLNRRNVGIASGTAVVVFAAAYAIWRNRSNRTS